ncbi:MAG TPA: GerMN domain-containing protein, partial [Verrucomicrobiae bacterium]|nr:GerMN domain-containing protein [Verrucomicrobiae bacterium]
AKDSFNSLLGLSNTPTVGNEVVGETRSVTVYFADATGKNLVPQEVQIPKTLSLARETLNELLKGPASGSNLLAVVPQGTVLLDINIKDDTAIVDLSKEILKTAAKVSPETTVYAFVNTLTQFPTIKQVKFRVDGQPVQKIGTVNTTQALSRNTSSVKKHPITQKPASGSQTQVTPVPSGT